MRKSKDMIGYNSGKLTVIEKIGIKNHAMNWLCQCECGNTKILSTRKLTSGDYKSCGCSRNIKPPKPVKDMSGMKFGRLTVLYKDEKQTKNHETRWICKCECGNIKSISRGQLLAGETNSCGCLRKEVLSKKYPRKGRLYQCWLDMKQRCYNSKNKYYSDYGGRGITVCQEWLDDYCTFYEWAMSHGYADDLTIDRIDDNGNYCPENCRWATPKEQTNNRRVTKYVEINGIRKPRSEWAKILGISYRKMRYLDDNGKLDEFIKNS